MNARAPDAVTTSPGMILAGEVVKFHGLEGSDE